MLVRELGPRFTLHGTEGSFLKYGFDPQEEALNQGRTPDEPHWGEEAKDLWGTLNTQVAGLHIQGRVETIPGRYQTFYENIADAIKGRAELAVRPEEARNTIRMIELAIQSHAEKRTVPFSQ
jgi:predicted dehydrogenase